MFLILKSYVLKFSIVIYKHHIDLKSEIFKRRPEFLSDLHKRVILSGSDIRLSLRTLSYPDPTVTWYYNDEEISGPCKTFPNLKIKYQNHVASLIIPSAVPKYSGRYSCVLENESGKAEASGVIVVASRPVILRKFVDQELYNGETLQLMCSFEAFPLPRVTWLQNKVVLMVCYLFFYLLLL